VHFPQLLDFVGPKDQTRFSRTIFCESICESLFANFSNGNFSKARNCGNMLASVYVLAVNRMSL
jgi:hypothetical protein